MKDRQHLDPVVCGNGPHEEPWRRVATGVARLRAVDASRLAEFPGHQVVMADPEGTECWVT